jgi:hypothetical protein
MLLKNLKLENIIDLNCSLSFTNVILRRFRRWRLNGGYCRPLGYYIDTSIAASGIHSAAKAADSDAALLSSLIPAMPILSTQLSTTIIDRHSLQRVLLNLATGLFIHNGERVEDLGSRQAGD